MAKKLDRVLINDLWSSWFAHLLVEFLSPEVSDHCPSLIKLQQDTFSPPKPFKFFNFWSQHHEFLQIVEKSWVIPIVGRPMYVLHCKLKRLKVDLKLFNQSHFGGISARVIEKRKK